VQLLIRTGLDWMVQGEIAESPGVRHVGWSDPEGSRRHLGTLLLGYCTDDGKLITSAE
jgi:hypothetical protein